MLRRLRPLLAGAALACVLAVPAAAGAQAPPGPGPTPPAPAPPAPPVPPSPAPPPPVPPTPTPTPVSEYCSPSGDVCMRTLARGGQIYLELGAQARYFPRYRLCVFSPTRRRDCKVFTLRRRGQTFGSVVRWQRSFPARGVGRYRATWSANGRRLGPSLIFDIEASRTVGTG